MFHAFLSPLLVSTKKVSQNHRAMFDLMQKLWFPVFLFNQLESAAASTNCKDSKFKSMPDVEGSFN